MATSFCIIYQSNKHKLKDFPEKERKIWRQDRQYDWSAQICAGATIDDLDTEAIARARIEYKNKNLRLASDVDAWDDRTFLNKAKLTIKDQITRSAILLLGKEESEHFISPAVAKTSGRIVNLFGFFLISPNKKNFKKNSIYKCRYIGNGICKCSSSTSVF